MEYFVPSTDLTTGALITIGLVLCLYLAILPRPLPGIPYHKPSARKPLGDALDFLSYSRREGDMFGLLPMRMKELNSPVMQIFLLPLQRPRVVVSDPHEMNDILTRRTKEFDRSNYFRDTWKALLPGNQIHFATGTRWKAHRRLIGDTMSPSFLHEVAGPLFWTSTQDLIELWRIKLRSAQGRPFSAAQDVHRTALEMVWHATFGFESGSVKNQIELLSTTQTAESPVSIGSAVEFPQVQHPPAFDAILKLTRSLEIPITSLIPNVHHYLALKMTPSLVASSKHKNALIRERVAIAKQNVSSLGTDAVSNKQYTSAVDLVTHRERTMAQQEGREPDYDSVDIADELFGFLVAGHDTTSTTTCWALKFLAADRRVQNKLRTTLQTTFVEARSTAAQPTIEDITSHNIPYLEAVIAEIHRKAMTAIAVLRVAMVDTTILGHHIPRGTDVIFLNSGAGFQTPAFPIGDTHRSKTSLQTKEKRPDWEPEDIGEFVPERWLRTNSDGIEEYNSQAGPSLPFGAGPRACFGRKWAQLELKVILTLIIWNFDLQPPPPELASFRAVDRVTHQPQQCYVKLSEVGIKT